MTFDPTMPVASGTWAAAQMPKLHAPGVPGLPLPFIEGKNIITSMTIYMTITEPRMFMMCKMQVIYVIEYSVVSTSWLVLTGQDMKTLWLNVLVWRLDKGPFFNLQGCALILPGRNLEGS